jgi:hypothetical protein
VPIQSATKCEVLSYDFSKQQVNVQRKLKNKLLLLMVPLWIGKMWRSGAVDCAKEGLMFTTSKGVAGHLWSLTTSHLAGLWIGAAISNTSHPNKAGSTTVKRAPLKVKDQGRRQCCHNEHKKISLSVYTWCIFSFRTRLIYGRRPPVLLYSFVVPVQ